MHPARALLIPALEQVFRDTSGSDGARSLVASVLANFAAEDSHVLSTLLLDANEHQFGVIFRALSGYRAIVAPRMALLVKSSPPPAATREDRSDFARRQANAAIALVRLGSADPLWPLLAASADPGLRSFLIDRLAPMENPTSILIERLSREPDSSVRAAILLSLRRFGSEQLPASERAGLVRYLLALYQDDPDAAVHSAAGSLLKIWGRGEQLRSADQGLVSVQSRGARRWSIARDGVTMVLLDGKRAFGMGSPEDEHGRLNNETQRTVDVGPFEIATSEVTVGQFRPYLEHDKSVLEHYPAPVNPSPDFPQTHVTWCEAAYYWNWRSQQEGIPEDQWCYEPRQDGKYEQGMKIKAYFISKIGDRLPTEVEWEYACRAGTLTSRCFGDSDELMVRYGCCLINTQELPVPVESFLPNAFGLFDMHGNVFEWCQGVEANQGNVASKSDEIVDKKIERVIRGGGFFTRPSHVRSASRYRDPPGLRNDAGGFRLVRSRPRPDAG